MPVPHYGIWVGEPLSFIAQRERIDPKSPHIYLKFKNSREEHRIYEAAINIKSLDHDTRLVFWLVENFQHSLTDTLQDLEPGFQSISNGDGLGIDYIRDGLITLSEGELLPHDLPGPNNDIIDRVAPILASAIKRKATIYIWGSEYSPRKDGIHDIHMNQGSLPRFENGVGQDGAVLLHFPDDGHWEGIFIAFASQRVPTDDRTGVPVPGAVELVDQLQTTDSADLNCE
ncbi:hypothetical protein G7Y89_g11971 [Cudoniella acicularis]|uniref:DUF2278 domain-containing protein n=1 Tax=Cudoniella acicularis TaxID=354080 RepID=A0A8H4VXD6_9HELO|nr:hypothetical protein G7Y89_g11971 [Cudoniella acicularis]